MTTPSINRVSASADDRSDLQKIFSASNIVLFLICLMYGLTYIDRINVNTASIVFATRKELNLDPKHVGWVFSAFGWAYLALQVHGGWLSDRFGARKTLTVCGIVWAGATIMTGLAGGFASMIVARAVLGLGEGATFPTATRALSDWSPASLRGFAQGITHAFSRLGNVSAGPVGEGLQHLQVLTYGARRSLQRQLFDVQDDRSGIGRMGGDDRVERTAVR